MQYDYDRSFTFKVNDDVWEAYLVTEDELKELDAKTGDDPEFEGDDDVPAMVIPNKKCLFITEGHVTKNIINHELFHIFVEYFYIGSADLDTDQFEEVVASFLEHRLDSYLKIRNLLYRKYKKLEGST